MSGYVTDTTYADTFFRELSPAWLNYVAAVNGVAPRPLDSAFRYLELGCGFGTTAVINAAAFPHATFDACDLNVAHIDGGRAYTSRLGVANIALHATAFADLLARRDLHPYDFIVLHGVYSWVDADSRRVLRELLAKLLRPGGLAYVSYNALPGWSAELPLRKLLVELAAGQTGTAAQQSERAAAAIDALSRAGLRYFSANPAARSAVDAYTRGEGHYLAHEFMNAAWEPFYSVDVADELGAIDLQFAGSATLANNHLPLMLDQSSADAIAALTTPRQQQLAIDFAINQRFRRDVFVRADGSPRSSEHLGATVIGCAGDVDDIGVTARVPRGEIRMQDAFVRDVRALFAQRSLPFGDAVEQLSGSASGSRVGVERRSPHGDRDGIARNLLFLVASGVLAPFARAATVGMTQPTRLANPVMERAVHADPVRAGAQVIPSMTYGNGVEIDAATMTALREWSRGRPVSEGFRARRLPTFTRLAIVE